MAPRMTVPKLRMRRAAGAALATLVLFLAGPPALANGSASAPPAEVAVRLRVAFEPDLGVAARATIAVADLELDLTDAWTEARLAPGSHPVAIRTPGLALVGAPHLDVAATGGAEHTLLVRPTPRLLAPEVVEVDARGRAEVRVGIVSEYPHAIPVSLAAQSAAGVRHHTAHALRGVARSDLRPELLLLVTVDPDADAMVLRMEPGGVERRVAWRHPAGAAGSHGTAPEPAADVAAPHADAGDVHLDVDGPAEVLLPGDRASVHATIRNDGAVPVTYALRWRAPAWFDGDAVEVVGALAPGASERHAFDARVAFGPPAADAVEALLELDGEQLVAAHVVHRQLLEVAWVDDRHRVGAGDEHRSVVRVTNPTDRDLWLTPLVALGGAVERTAATPTDGADAWHAPPGDSDHDLRWHARTVGEGLLELALALGDQGLVAHRLAREVLVDAAAAPTRRTTARVEIALSHPVAEVLVWLALPDGALVAEGSSRLDSAAASDPVEVAGGALWRFALGDARSAWLAFDLTHDLPLPPLHEPVLAARAGATLVPLAGTLPDAALETLPSAAATAPHPRASTARDADGRPAPSGAAERAFGTTWAATGGAAAIPNVRVLEPPHGATFRPDEAVRVVIDAAIGSQVELFLNDERVPDSRLGLAQHDPASGRLRLEYYGLDFRSGANTIAARATHGSDVVEVYQARAPERLEVLPAQVRADGVTPILLEVLALDDEGVPNGFGPLQVASARPLLDADAYPELAGHHVLLRDGRAWLRFAPSVAGGVVEVELRYAELTKRVRVPLDAEPRLLWTAEGSLSASLSGTDVRLGAAGRAYLEASGGFGTVQFAFDGDLRLEPDMTVRFASGWWDAPSARFPVTGARAERSEAPPRSDDGFALRYEGTGLAVRYEAGPVAVPGVSHEAYGSALQVEAQVGESHTATVVAGLLPLQQVVQRIEPDGTRRYRLDATPRPGSERVTLRVSRDGLLRDVVVLRAGDDYVIDRHEPALILARALWMTDLDGNDLALEVTFAAEDAPREAATVGAGWTYRDGPWTVEAGAAHLPHATGTGTAFGVVARYRELGLEVAAGLERRLWETTGRARLDLRWYAPDAAVWGAAELGVEQRASLHGRVRWPAVGVELGADVRVARDEASAFDGFARVALTERLRLHLRHLLDVDGHASSALLEHAAGAGSLLGGLRYRWQEGDVLAIAGGSWQHGVARVRFEHAQGLATTTPSTSELELRLPLLSALLRVRLDHVWGGATRGALGVQQRIAERVDADLELRLSDGAPVARAALSAPLALSDELRLDLQAGVERTLEAGGATRAGFSVGARYTGATLAAGAAVDLALRPEGTKLVLQADARWSPGPAHALAIDAHAQLLGETTARVSVAYAYHGPDVSVLTYHRARFEPALTLEGELGVAWRPAAAWSVRPGLAYRALGADADALLLQSGLGVAHHAANGVHLGAVLYHAWQPSLSTGAVAFGGEIGYEVAPGASLVLGYTFGEGPGLLAGGAPGAHFRIDVHGGTR